MIISYVFTLQIGQGTDISVRLNYTEEFSPILHNFDVEDEFSLVFGSFLHSETGSGYSFPLDESTKIVILLTTEITC